MEHDIRIKYATSNDKNYRDITFESEQEAYVFFEDVINNKGFVKAPGAIWINSAYVLEICEPQPLEVDYK